MRTSDRLIEATIMLNARIAKAGRTIGRAVQGTMQDCALAWALATHSLRRPIVRIRQDKDGTFRIEQSSIASGKWSTVHEIYNDRSQVPAGAWVSRWGAVAGLNPVRTAPIFEAHFRGFNSRLEASAALIEADRILQERHAADRQEILNEYA